MKTKLLTLLALVVSVITLSSREAQAEGSCLYRVSLTTTYWYYEGEGSTYQSAQRDAVLKCIRSGTIPRVCEDAKIDVLDRQCYFSCTIVTGYGWVYDGFGSTREMAVNNAINKCIRSGTIPNACRNATVSCEQ